MSTQLHPGHWDDPVICARMCMTGSQPCMILLVCISWVCVRLFCADLTAFQSNVSNTSGDHLYFLQQYLCIGCFHRDFKICGLLFVVIHVPPIFSSARDPVYGSIVVGLRDGAPPCLINVSDVHVANLSHSIFNRAGRFNVGLLLFGVYSGGSRAFVVYRSKCSFILGCRES